MSQDIEPVKDLRDEIIGRLTLKLEEEREFNRKIVEEFNSLRDNLTKLCSGSPRYYNLRIHNPLEF